MTLTRVDKRTFKTFEEYEERLREEFTDIGTNHRILSDGIARDIGTKVVWGIRINTLEELLDFKNKVKEEIIIRESYVDKETLCLEIYDNYRE